MSVRKRMWTTRLGEQKEAWIVDYSDQSGTRRLKTFERKKEADAYAQQVGVDIRAGVHTSTKTTVAQAGKTWVEDAKHRLEPATVDLLAERLRFSCASVAAMLLILELEGRVAPHPGGRYGRTP